MMLTCMQKKVKKVKVPPEQHVDHLHEEESEVQVLFNPKCHEGHLHAEEGEDQVQVPPRKACGSPARRRR